jgi:hypothetical protein
MNAELTAISASKISPVSVLNWMIVSAIVRPACPNGQELSLNKKTLALPVWLYST